MGSPAFAAAFFGLIYVGCYRHALVMNSETRLGRWLADLDIVSFSRIICLCLSDKP
jgi:hypothetical protein